MICFMFYFIDDDLLDIGRDMESTTDHKKSFYTDQKSTRKCRLSEEIDEDFESERQAAIEEVKKACARISSVCGVSVETSRKAILIV